ncbi:transposase [Anaerosolibacter carboniphilus]|uniref:Transposase n=1 Tax=Anaerosolibacter carboniphilus TaxID=1417629 RepID=A0A841L7K7_9FIRM|nr:IS110 family transposase [Anaerosolibacter carboniphilus]MBB6219052.1 transposase [Anaerosolibacter carboniphilus]
MQDILEVCAGLDVHEKTVVACVLNGKLNKAPQKEIETFGTTTQELFQLLEWLEVRGCTHVVMESTGVYWKPVWNILESGSFELILANAYQIKNLPGRKTDIKDSEWLAQLLRSGLISKSFVPSQPIRELRDLTRYRKKLLYEVNKEKNRVHKTLQDCNIKITSYLADIFGDTGRKIIEKILEKRTVTEGDLYVILSGRGKSKLKGKAGDLLKALQGKVEEHHVRMIQYCYDHILFLEKQIEGIDEEIAQYMNAYEEEVTLLDSIPGINETAAAVIIGEIGADMNQFPTDKQLSSWAGLSPGNNESAGKKKEVKSLRETKC